MSMKMGLLIMHDIHHVLCSFACTPISRVLTGFAVGVDKRYRYQKYPCCVDSRRRASGLNIPVDYATLGQGTHPVKPNGSAPLEGSGHGRLDRHSECLCAFFPPLLVFFFFINQGKNMLSVVSICVQRIAYEEAKGAVRARHVVESILT